MLKIDIHTHILPENLPDFNKKFGYDGFVTLQHSESGCAKMMKNDETFRNINSNSWDPNVRIEECNNTGVDVQVLSTIPVMFNYWAKPKDTFELSKFLNNQIANICHKNSKRFVGLGTVPLQETDLAIKEMDRCVNELGFAGIEIGTHVNGWNLDHPNLFPFFEAAQTLSASIFIHPWEMLAPERMEKYGLQWLVGMPTETSIAICSMIFGGVFERLPKLQVAFAHGGGSFPASLGRIEKGFKVRPDLVAKTNKINPREYLGKFYIDSLVHDKTILKNLIELIGPECIAMGSDYPFPLGEEIPGQLIESLTNVNNQIKQRMLSGTALEWLGLQKKDFLN